LTRDQVGIYKTLFFADFTHVSFEIVISVPIGSLFSASLIIPEKIGQALDPISEGSYIREIIPNICRNSQTPILFIYSCIRPIFFYRSHGQVGAIV